MKRDEYILPVLLVFVIVLVIIDLFLNELDLYAWIMIVESCIIAGFIINMMIRDRRNKR